MLGRMKSKIADLQATKDSAQEREILNTLAAGLAVLEKDEQKAFREDGEKEEAKDSFLMLPKEMAFNFQLYSSAFRKFTRAFLALKKLDPTSSFNELQDERILLSIHLEVLSQTQLSLKELEHYRDFKKENENGLQIKAELKEFLGLMLNPRPLEFVNERQKQHQADSKNMSRHMSNLEKDIRGFEKTEQEFASLQHEMTEALKDKEKMRELRRQRTNVVCLQQGKQHFTLFERPRQSGDELPSTVPARPKSKPITEINLAALIQENYKDKKEATKEDTLDIDDFEMVAPSPKPRGRGGK